MRFEVMTYGVTGSRGRFALGLATLLFVCLAASAAPAANPPLPPGVCPADPGVAGLYLARSGDFDGDGNDDINLQPETSVEPVTIPYGVTLDVSLTSLLPSLVLQDDGAGGYTLIVEPDPAQVAGVSWTLGIHDIRRGDFDGDGAPDLFIWAQFTGGRNVVLLDVDAGSVPSIEQVISGTDLGAELSAESGKSVCALDLNLDARADLLVEDAGGNQVAYAGTTGSLGQLVDYPPCSVAGERDSDCDTVPDRDDAFPFDPTETTDTDGDLVGNIADTDDDGDGILDGSDTLPLDPNNGVAVGALAGSFDVSPIGKASYRIPIRGVPSVAGIAPDLSIAYAGEAGNGLLGMGWFIEGLSRITRCPTTLAQDTYVNGVNFNSSDKFCLNGERLVAVSGAYGADATEYRTEREGHARIFSLGAAGGGPDSFTVERRTGEIETYGGTANSQRETQGSADILTWAISELRDREGNYASFQYTEDQAEGDFRIARIDYTGNAAAGLTAENSIRFEYEVRDDVLPSRADSTITTESERMTRVAVYLGSTKVRSYELGYTTPGGPADDYDGLNARSRLKSVTECVNDAGCLPPTVFSWDVNDPNANFAVAGTSESFQAAAAYDDERYHLGDVNGDGQADLVWTYRDINRLARKVLLARADGSGFDAQAEENETGFYASLADAQGTLLQDVNGDGRDDLVWVAFDGNTLYRAIYRARADGSGFDALGYEVDSDSEYNLIDDHRFESADVNGDGREDLVWIFRSQERIGRVVYRATTDAGGTPSLGKVSFDTDEDLVPSAYNNQQFTTGDVNGDGKDDLAWTFTFNDKFFRVLYLANASGSGFLKISLGVDDDIFPTDSLFRDQKALLGDVNHDGKADLIWTFNYNDQLGRILYLSSRLGTSFDRIGPKVVAAPVGVTPNTHVMPDARAVDVNRDGQSDIVYSYYDATQNLFGWVTFLANGDASGFVEAGTGTFGVPPSQQNNDYHYADVNGDGAGDLVWTYRDPSLNQFQVLHPYQPEAYPDHIQTLTDGLGKQISISYEYLVGSGLYTAGTGSTYPVRESPGLGFVVSHVDVSDGIGGSSGFDYAYEGARTDLRGRGYLGFAARSITDNQSGFVTRESYRQDFPFMGQVKSVVVKTATAVPVSKTFRHWAQATIAHAGGGDTVFPYLRDSVALAYELNTGLAASATLVENVHDTALGNLSQATTTVGSDFSGPIDASFDPDGSFDSANVVNAELTITTINGFTDTATDLTNWRFGFLSSETGTTHLEDGSETDRVVTRQLVPWSATSFLTASETHFVGTDVETTNTFSRDGFGNITQTVAAGEDIGGGSVAPQTDSAGPFLAGLYPQSVKNDLLHETQLEYDALLGEITRSSDPNGLVTDSSYDGLGRLLQQIAPDGTNTINRYAPCDASCPPRAVFRVTTTVTHPARPGQLGAPTTTRYFDILQREVRNETLGFDGRLVRVDTNHDTRGRVAQVSEPYFEGEASIFTVFGYDDFDRVTTVALPSGGSVTHTHDNTAGISSRTISVEQILDPIGGARNVTTQTQRNARGQIVYSLDGNSVPTDLSYDGHGNLKSVRVNSNAATDVTIVTDVAGNKRSISDPDAGAISFEYDSLGRLRRKTHGSGGDQAVETTAYDTLGRISSRIDDLGGASSTASWVYDTAANGIGKLASVSQPDFQRTLEYDFLSRQSSSSTTLTGLQPTQSFGFSYDAFSRSVGFAYPSGFSAVSRYGGNGYRVRIEDGSGADLWRAEAADARVAITNETLANGLTTTRAYDPATGQLQTIATGTGGSVQQLAYTYDSAGNLVRRQSTRGGAESLVETFSYDAGHRLGTAGTTGLSGGPRNLVYDYDALGNLKSKTGVSDPDGYTYGGNGGGVHAVSSVTLGGVPTQYFYDGRGNMTAAGSRTIGYAAFNKSTQIMASGLDTEMRYGPDRARYYQRTDAGGRVTETSYYEGGLYEIVQEGGQIRRKAYVEGILVHVTRELAGSPGAGAELVYLHRDHVGSVEAVTGSVGGLRARPAFAPFGARRADDWSEPDAAFAAALPDRTFANTTQGYTGQEHLDASGFIHLGGRVYDPVIGRFVSPDPFVAAPELAAGYNRYTYARNNPLRYTDTSGRTPIDAISGGASEGARRAGSGEGPSILLPSLDGASAGGRSVGGRMVLIGSAGTAGTRVQPLGRASSVSGADAEVSRGRLSASSRRDLDRTLFSFAPLFERAIGGGRAAEFAAGCRGNAGCLSVAASMQQRVRNQANFFSAVTFGILTVAPLAGELGAARSGLAASAARGSASQKLFHFTQSRNAAGIAKQGLRPGARGKVFTTPQGELSPIQAQIDLALPPNRGLPDAVFEIDVGKLRRLGIDIPAPSQVGRGYNLPGGGLEVPIEGRIPAEALRRIR